jgi:RNA polymerase sigma factor (sigma-70 family)
MENLFAVGYTGDIADATLVERARQGERAALEELIRRHQQWIFNIALRMVGSPHDAQDVTQEILIKLMTKLSTFKGRSSFRTWLYRLVVNHALTMRRRPWERMFSSFGTQARLIDSLAPSDAAPGRNAAEEELLVWEARSGCLTGMLLCLDRPQRIAIVLSTLFGADSTLGGDLLETSPENYRQILSRARRQLSQFMNEKCGLMNEANPCRCARKTRAAIDRGLIDPEKLRFNMQYMSRVKDFVAAETHRPEQDLEAKLRGILSDQPLYSSPDYRRVLRIMLRRGELGRIVNFR